MKKFFLSMAGVALMGSAYVQAQTPNDPPVLNFDPSEVGVVFAADQDTYSNVITDGNGDPAYNWAPVSWGQSCVISNDECNGGASAIRIDNLDFLPLQMPGTISFAKWRYLHIDMWAPNDDQVCFKLQNWYPGEAYVSQIYDLKGGEWTAIDIDMEDPEYFQWSEIKTDPDTQEKYTNKGVNVFQVGGEKIANDYPHSDVIYMTNIIAYNTENAGIDSITINSSKEDKRIFNMMGVQVDENYKGLVIRNGKKYIQR